MLFRIPLHISNHISKLPSWSLGQYSKWNPGWKLRKSSPSWKQISQRFPRFTSPIYQGKTSSPQSQCARPGTIRKLAESKFRQKSDTRGHFLGETIMGGIDLIDCLRLRPNSFLILAQPCQPCLVRPTIFLPYHQHHHKLFIKDLVQLIILHFVTELFFAIIL